MKRLIPLIFLMLPYLLGAQERAIDILREAENRQTFDTSRSEMSMLIFPNKDNKKEFRHLRLQGFSMGDDYSYMEFIEPRSIKGLRILSREGDQWIYFPSTGRVRKIASKSKGSSVQGVGGDFNYEDMGGGRWEEKYDFIIIDDNRKDWVLEGSPKEEDSVYSKMLITIAKEDYQVSKVDYYDKEDGHFKSLFLTEIKDLGGREVPTRMSMVNFRKNTMTVIVSHDAEYDIPVDEKYFSPTRFYK